MWLSITGLRASELIGLRWRNVQENTPTVEERCCRGDWGVPKSEASAATIAVNRCVIERIHRLKLLTVNVKAGRATLKYRVVKSDGPDDLVFQGVKNGQPMRDNNILSRFLKPAGRQYGLPFVNWRCLRTSHATWLKLAGADVKDAQAQMRHSRASTTLDLYQQFVTERQVEVVTNCGRICLGNKKLTSAPSLPARRSASRKCTTISGWSALWIMIWDTSILIPGCWNLWATPSAQGCHPCSRYIL